MQKWDRDNSYYILSANTANAQQIDIAVEIKTNGTLEDSLKKGDSRTDTWHIKIVKQVLKHNMGEKYKPETKYIYHKEIPRSRIEVMWNSQKPFSVLDLSKND